MFKFRRCARQTVVRQHAESLRDGKFPRNFSAQEVACRQSVRRELFCRMCYRPSSQFSPGESLATARATAANGRAPRTRWTYTASRRARSRRSSQLDFRRRQPARRIRRQSLPLLLQHFPSSGRHALAERPAASRSQGFHLQISPLAQRSARRPGRSHPSRKIKTRTAQVEFPKTKRPAGIPPSVLFTPHTLSALRAPGSRISCGKSSARIAVRATTSAAWR
jgi:hypothetical protein